MSPRFKARLDRLEQAIQPGGRFSSCANPTQELVDQIATYEAEDGVTARDILVIRRNLAPGLSSVITVSVLSLRTVICVRCVSAAGVPVHNIELDQ